MKKFLKIFFISLGSLVLLLAIVIGVALWIIFTPDRLTPIVRNQAEKFITCPTEIGSVELTFFSTFPGFGIKIDNVALINPIDEANCDTLLQAEQVKANINISALIKNNELILDNIRLSNGSAYAFINSKGEANFDILPQDTTVQDTTAFILPFDQIDVNSIELDNINITYADNLSGIQAEINNFSAKIAASLASMEAIKATLDISPTDIFFIDKETYMEAEVLHFSGKIKGDMQGENINLDISLLPFGLSFCYDGESYLQDMQTQISLQANANLSDFSANIKNLSASFNTLPLNINGSVALDTTNNNITTNLTYDIDSWKIGDLISMIPPSFSSYVEGIEADGILSSNGKITGIYNDSIMPLVDLNLALQNANVYYPELLPLAVNDINGDLNVYTDLTNDDISYVRINNLNAKTRNSTIGTKGTVDHLLSDMYIRLTTNVDLNLSDFKDMVPEDMKVDMAGKLKGDIKTDFSLSQLENLALDKIKASGSFALNSLNVQYDSISLQADRSNINIQLPNSHPSTKNTGFAAVSINSNSLQASMIDGFDASLQNILVGLETSDVRDTANIPGILVRLTAQKVDASLDTMAISIANPIARVSVSPQRRNAEKPRFSVSIKSDELAGNMGEDLKALIDKMDINASVTYNSKEEDIFLKWMPRGKADINNAHITMSSLSYPVEIPAVKMDFNPKELNMEETSLKLGDSDFKLSGKLENIVGYFRGEDFLTGEFVLDSKHTNIDQIMILTSGIGYEEEELMPQENDEEVLSGPYMVPRAMEIMLHTNIKEGTVLDNSIKNIKGDVLVRDGLLFMNDLQFQTKGADMQLTAMYRTPRRNHLYLGLDFHMLNMEIKELLGMVPDLDTIVPMLRSFDGRGEFHIIAELNLDSLYNPKMSQALGAMYINAQDLVLMDGETFSEIARMLRFNKKSENRVDSLSVELTLFRDEIDVYPFMLVMDKYKVIVGGRHNTDMSFDYNITLFESPLPFRASVAVRGTLDDMDFKLTKGKYVDLYRPVRREVMQQNKLNFMEIIKEALLKQVKRSREEEEAANEQ